MVAPQSLISKPSGTDGKIDFVVFVTVTGDNGDDTPVFFLELKATNKLNNNTGREEADMQMRERFEIMKEEQLCRLPVLHGVSAMGPYFAYYSMDMATGAINPGFIAYDPETIGANEAIPKGRWQADVTTEAGYALFMNTVKVVKDLVIATNANAHANVDANVDANADADADANA